MNTMCYNKRMRAAKQRMQWIWILALVTAFLLMAQGCDPFIVSEGKTAKLYINEAVSSNAVSFIHEELGSPDWVELYNASNQDINLSGYGLTDNIRDPYKWKFPNVTIRSGEYLVVFAQRTDIQTDELITGFQLSKAGDNIYLLDPYTNVISELALPSLLTDVSYARRDDGTYGYCGSPTPGAYNAAEIVSIPSEIRYSTSGDALLLSEVMPKNTSSFAASDGKYYPWAELYNASGSPILLSQYYLSDSTDDLTKWRLPDYILGANQYAVVFFGGADAEISGLNAPFRLGNEDDSLFLSYDNGNKGAKASWFLGFPANVSVLPDGQFTAFPTPNGPNSAISFTASSFTQMDAAHPVIINEALPRNAYSIADEYGDRSDWVELYNRSDQTISLETYCLSDDADDPAKWQFPAGAKLLPGEYLVVFLSGQKSTQTQYHAPFSLSDSDGVIMLTDLNGLFTNTFAIPENIGPNISIGLDQLGKIKYFTTPTPGALNATHAFDSLDLADFFKPNGVYVSEVSAVGAPRSQTPDWVELYNGGGSAVNLNGWHITDDPLLPQKYMIQDVSISAKGYAVIDASNLTGGGGALFSVSPRGETLMLSNGDGEIMDVFSTGALKSTISSGRVEGSKERVFFTAKTKRAANAMPLPGYVSPPIFSVTDLYHTNDFRLTLSSLTEGAIIYYTTDGSKPTAASTRYNGPIAISSSTPVRAIAVRSGLMESDAVSRTYLFDAPHTVPVVCLMADASDFGAVYSVTERAQKLEREGVFSYYEPNGALGLETPCGLRLSGASSLKYSQKSFNVYFRGAYGRSDVSYPFWPDTHGNAFSSIVLRNSGQDLFTTRMRDSFFMKAVKGLHIEHVETRVVVVYINGKYYGIYDLNENQNEDYMASHYGVNPDAVDIIRRNETPLEGSRYEFLRVREYARTHNMQNEEYYRKLCEWIDVDYFSDYLIAQTYFSNADMFNQKYWRSRDYRIKWRPVYFDLDLSMSGGRVTSNILPDYFTPKGVPSRDGSLTNMDIYCALRQSPIWCKQFCERYVWVVINHFDPDRLLPLFDEHVSTLKLEMPRHIARWKDISSMARWESSLFALRNCIENRSGYALKNLQKEFGLSDAQMEDYKAKASQS